MPRVRLRRRPPRPQSGPTRETTARVRPTTACPASSCFPTRRHRRCADECEHETPLGVRLPYSPDVHLHHLSAAERSVRGELGGLPAPGSRAPEPAPVPRPTP